MNVVDSQLLLENIEKNIMGCDKCPRLRDVTPIPYPHIYYGKSLKIMVIGRNPGLEHDYKGVSSEEFMKVYKERFLISRVGQYLLEHLGEKIVMNSLFFCNVCKCSSPNNEKLMPSEKERCYEFLEQQVKTIKPKIIITLGTDAKDALEENCVDHKYDGIPVFNMYHPSYFAYISKDDPKRKRQDLLLSSIREKFS